MRPELAEEVLQWLSKAATDLLGADTLLSCGRPLASTACFLCQQAAEKALKAFLVLRDTPFRKSHSIEYLLDLCVPLDAAFDSLRESARTLTPYAWEFRYPGGPVDPPMDEARHALSLARACARFVLARMPEDLRRQAEGLGQI